MIYIGISGWVYPSWRGQFYPTGLPHRSELAYASRKFNSIEINSTFYSLKSPKVFRRWHDDTPPGFIFALKGSRFITHVKRLVDVEVPLANFFASGVLELGPKLGPILWQLPEAAHFDQARLERFLALLPRDTDAAARLAARHDRGPAVDIAHQVQEPRKIRYAFELRHQSFHVPDLVNLLCRAEVALVVSDAPHWPTFEDVTADFVYLRLHGNEILYQSGYDASALDWWARRIALWAAGQEPGDARRLPIRPHSQRPCDVYVYFDNDAGGRAHNDALSLVSRVNHPAAARRLVQQGQREEKNGSDALH